MAQEVLVKESITTEMIAGGKELTRRLDETTLDVTASLWFYFVDNQRWDLILGIHQILEEGPLKSINIIRNTLSKHPIEGVDFSDVLPIQSDHSLIRRLKAVITTGKTIQDIRISQTVVENVFIQDAYIYRLMWKPEYR